MGSQKKTKYDIWDPSIYDSTYHKLFTPLAHNEKDIFVQTITDCLLILYMYFKNSLPWTCKIT